MNDPSRRINVLFVMIQMEMGGSERLIYNLARTLDRAVFNPSLAWFYGDRVLDEFKELRIPLYHVPKAKRIDLSTMKTMGEIIARNNIDVVNAHHFLSLIYCFYGSKIKNNSGLVYTEHSEWELEQIPRKWRALGGCLLRRADALVGVSEAVSTRLQQTFNADPARTVSITNGAGQGAGIDRRRQHALRKELGIANGDRVVGIVANLKKIKNHKLLLAAFLELVRERQGVKLLLVGQGFDHDPDNSEPEVRAFIAANGLAKKVILTGYRPDVPDLLSLMDVFCLTSFNEGLPISLIEAMAAGLPVVGTDVDGIREVIVQGENGFLVPLGDPKSLKKALLTLLSDPELRRKFGNESLRTAKKCYSLDNCCGRYQELFLSITHKSNPRRPATVMRNCVREEADQSQKHI